MSPKTLSLIQGTLEFLILEALSHGELLHGFDILDWIFEQSGGALTIEEGSLYPALHRMEKRRLLQSEWGVSPKGRRAKYYRLTANGKRQAKQEEQDWEAYVGIVSKIMQAAR